MTEAHPLPDQLRHVRWIGGGSGAGKSTVARRLAARYGVHVYSTDEVMAEHARRSRPDERPLLTAFLGMTMDERWVDRPPQLMLETFHWFRGEGFHLIVEDLLRLSAERRVVVEGFRLLPDLVEPLLAQRSQAVWLLPTPQVRRAAFEARGTVRDIAGRTSEPERALANLLERDRLFTDRLREQTAALRLRTVEVGTATDEEDVARRTAASLGLDRG